MPKPAVIILLCLLAYFLPLNTFADEYDFEIPDTKDKPYNIGGNIEAGYAIYSLNKNSELYCQKFYTQPGVILKCSPGRFSGIFFTELPRAYENGVTH